MCIYLYSDETPLRPWSPTPTLAERKREEMRARLSNLGIRLDGTSNSSSVGEGLSPGSNNTRLSATPPPPVLTEAAAAEPPKLKLNGESLVKFPG